jgi:hypothetical protein
MTTPKTEEDLVTGYRSAAEECRQQAGRAATQLLRDHCLKIADEWIKLAEEAEPPATSADEPSTQLRGRPTLRGTVRGAPSGFLP